METEETVPIHHGHAASGAGQRCHDDISRWRLGMGIGMGASATLQHHAAIMLILQSSHCRIHTRCNIGIDEVVIDKPNLIQIQM